MTEHLNGPESDDQLDARHERYLRLGRQGEAQMFVIEDAGCAVGSIGWWCIDWRGTEALETGWFVLPEAQGRGVASTALPLLVGHARRHRAGRRLLAAFPSTENAASNGVCRRNGFTLVGAVSETFRGGNLTVNEWVLDLESSPEDQR